jgi:hypothetical protein
VLRAAPAGWLPSDLNHRSFASPKVLGMVRDHIWWPVSIAFIILWHILAQQLLNTYVTDGKCIKRPFIWIFSYVALSAGYCTVRFPEVSFLTQVDHLFVGMNGVSGLKTCDRK